MSKVAVVTGATSGIGLATLKLLREKGWTVYGISRRAEGDKMLAADVSDESAVNAAIEEIYSREGKIDLLVNNAGMGISGSVEKSGMEDIRRIFDVNFFGGLYCTRAVLPRMREAGGGRIINVSSVAAPIAIPFQSFYSATKAAINSVTLALRNEAAQYDIKVCAVMPGDVRTGFTDARKKTADDYKNAESAVASMEKDERSGMSPDAVAKIIVRAAEKISPKPLYVAGAKYKVFYFLFKVLPASLAYKIVGMMYK